MSEPQTPWERGRFDARSGPKRVLFGRMYEDPQVELSVFVPRTRVFCIASAGCTAMRLAARHRVTAADLNPRQLAYAHSRLAGGPSVRGTAERVMDLMRSAAPVAGWTRARLRRFVDLADPAEQVAFWRRELSTARFRLAFDALLSVTALRAVYASAFLAFLPDRMGAVLRGRMERCFTRHPNRDNPYARALLLGELDDDPPLPEPGRIELVQGDAASLLEAAPAGSYGGITLSNVLDGASEDYRRRLLAAVKHAAAPGAKLVLRSFGEPRGDEQENRAAEDRSMLWGIVDVRDAAIV